MAQRKEVKSQPAPQRKHPEAKGSIYGISQEHASIIYYAKHLSQFSKGREYYPFVIDALKVGDFFKTLAANWHQLPEGSRFQLEVHNRFFGPTGHWFLIDCYKVLDNLHTLTLDAAMVPSAYLPALRYITSYFPEGKHYCYGNASGTKSIQQTLIHCQTFNRELSRLVAKMDPGELYFDALGRHAKVTIKEIKDCGSVPAQIKFFFIDDLKKMKLLVRLFRSMQSIGTLTDEKMFPDELQHLKVSGDKELHQWIAENKEQRVKERPGKGRGIIEVNASIDRKDARYFQKLQIYLKNKTVTEFGIFYYYAPFGFAALPFLLDINKKMAASDKAVLKELMGNFIAALERDIPKKALKMSVFSSQHLKKTQQVMTDLGLLMQRCDRDDYTSRQIAQAFCDIALSYGGYLWYKQSKRTFPLLKQLLLSLNVQLDEKPELKKS